MKEQIYIDCDVTVECGENQAICQRCGYDETEEYITQCEKCERYFCEFCMNEDGDLCKNCSDE